MRKTMKEMVTKHCSQCWEFSQYSPQFPDKNDEPSCVGCEHSIELLFG